MSRLHPEHGDTPIAGDTCSSTPFLLTLQDEKSCAAQFCNWLGGQKLQSNPEVIQIVGDGADGVVATRWCTNLNSCGLSRSHKITITLSKSRDLL